MTEETTQAVDGAVQAAADTDGKATDTTQAAGDGAETISLDEARKLRREAQSLRKRLAEFDAAEAKRKEQELSEVDKATKRAAELEAKLTAETKAHHERIVRYEVMLKASAMNAVDPDAVVRLLDMSSLEFDDDGQPTNVDKLLKELLKAKTYLLKPAETSAPNTNARAGNDKLDAKAKEEELRRRFRI